MSDKKKAKHVAHATMVWEREQLQAATAAEQIAKALAAVEFYKEELTESEVSSVYAKVEAQRGEIKDFLLAARNKYVNKLAELGVEPTLTKEG